MAVYSPWMEVRFCSPYILQSFYVHTYMCMYVYVHAYLERGREEEGDREREETQGEKSSTPDVMAMLNSSTSSIIMFLIASNIK